MLMKFTYKNFKTYSFRHLDTTVRLTPSRRNSATGGSSPSPENETGGSILANSKSPKRSPVMQRKRAVSPNPNGLGK